MAARHWVWGLALGAVLAGSGPALADGPADATLAPHYGSWGFDLAGEDLAVKPGDDFFAYANGTAIKALVIPPDRTRFGAFDTLSVLSENRVHAILEAASHAPDQTAPQKKIGDFYAAFMDEARINQLGAKPLKPLLAKVKAVTNRRAMAKLMGSRQTGFGASLIGLSIYADAKDPNHYAVYASQSGLNLPDRDYYLTPGLAEKKKAYQAYVAKMLKLIGWAHPDAAAADVVAYETALAEVSWARADRRDRDKTYNAMSVADFAAATPGLDVAALLAGADLKDLKRIIVRENTALPKLAAVFAKTKLSTLKAWEAFAVADDAAPYLSTEFVKTRFAFRNQVLQGQPELATRWKRAVASTNRALGEDVGQVYVARYFPPEAKAQMEALVGNLKAAFKVRIENLTWMSPETKAKALEKLAAFNVKIGYPKTWRSYDFKVVRTDLLGDVQRASASDWLRDVRRKDGPVDRSEWGMTPQTVNAYYDPSFNEIVFPAAILQPPFFDPKADPAINYGGIGGVIGHEMSHGFDDQGRKSDGTGRLKDWWTAEDAAKFKIEAKKLADQYSAFEPLPGVHVNGQLTLGENIGDMGGINLALDAYRHSLNGAAAPMVDGLTGDQRVFLGWAQVWRGKAREDALHQQLVVDPHSPPEERVNAVVRNVDAWYEAFGVKPGDKLYIPPQDRVKIW